MAEVAVAPAKIGPTSTTADHRRKFRPDIEGLRAIAVALVVLYHADISWLAGGYIGVDVFFVVSGFLITGLLVGELRERGTFSLAAFYARRMRRLLPASVLVLVATVVMVKLLLPPLASVGLRRDAMATALYASNVNFAIEGTAYLSDTAPSPLLHYWSLAVEEQFYLCWPLLLLVSWKLRRAALGLVVGVVGVASLVVSIVLTAENQPYAFFLLPARAWELAVGAGLALSIRRLRRLPAPVATALVWLGVAGIVAAALVYDARTPFPGTAALLPVLATAAVVAGGAVRPARLLATQPFVGIGRISYSLYLWHWPLLVIPAAYREDELSPAARAGLVALSVALAAITYALVEDRFRNLPALVRSHRASFAMGGVLTVVAVVAGYVGGVLPALDAGRPAAAAGTIDYVPSDLRPSLRGAFDDVPETWRNGCHADIPDRTPKGCLYGDPDSSTTVVLFGDSHAASWFPAFQAAADDAGWRLLTLTKSGCPSAAVSQWRSEVGRTYTECDDWRDASLARIAEERAPIVVLAGSRTSNVDVSEEELEVAWRAGYAETIAALPEDATPVLLADTPIAESNVPICLSGHLRDIEACALDRRDTVDDEFNDLERAIARDTGATFVDTIPWVCADFPCPVIRGDLLVLRDTNHLSSPFSASLAPRVIAELERLARG